MVRLALDPPSQAERSSRSPRVLLVVLAIVAAGAGGFYAGRRTAPRPVPAAAPEPAPPVAGAPAAGGGAGAVPSPAAPAPAPASPAAAPARGAGVPLPPGLRRLAVTLRGPLEESVVGSMPSGDRAVAEELTQVVNRLLVWHLQVAHDGRPGDRLEVLYEPSAASATTREPVVVAVRYTSQKLGRTLAAFRFRPEGAAFARYYQADGSELEERLQDGPIADYEQVTSLLRDGRRHKGVDFKTPVGSPVVSPFDGVVVRRNWHFAANGNCLELADPASGRHAIFLHLESASKAMQPGVKVRKGERIATSGNSGHSTAPHLHYQLESPDGRILDPFSIHRTRRIALDGAALGAFQKERGRLETLLGNG